MEGYPAGFQIIYTDRSGTIASGGTQQQLMPANAGRRGMWFQNQSSFDLWILDNGLAAASQPSLQLPPGSYFEYPKAGTPTTAISIFGSTTGQAFACKEW